MPFEPDFGQLNPAFGYDFIFAVFGTGMGHFLEKGQQMDKQRGKQSEKPAGYYKRQANWIVIAPQ